MPDLGKYAVTVLSAYGASLGLIAGLVIFILWRSARVRRALDAQERKSDT